MITKLGFMRRLGFGVKPKLYNDLFKVFRYVKDHRVC